jgi:hypothetical protein
LDDPDPPLLKGCAADTPKQYGYARLGLLLQAHPDLFELRQRSAGQYDLRLISAGQQR